MSKVFATSDWHFNHDRAFVWGARGFQSVEEMNEAIVRNHNAVVAEDDDVWVLGDLCLGGGSDEALAANKALIESVNGKLHIVLGNHDTTVRTVMYKTCKNVVEVVPAAYYKHGKYHFYFSHFPTLTGNLEKESLKQCTINGFGHTHQTTNFFEDRPYMFHFGCDSHNCTPVLLDDAIEEMKAEVLKCKEQL